MGWLFRRLVVLLGLGAFASYALIDNPQRTYGELYTEIRCKVDTSSCRGPVAYSILPGVSVLFVAKALVMREGRQVAVMAEEWPVCDDVTGDVFMVPKHFETDFASIPGWAQFYVKPSDKRVIGAAIIHDWLYAVGGDPLDEAKARADNIFRRELKNAGMNKLRRNIMYQAVAKFGGKTFGQDIEMRFRNPRTGLQSTKPKPAISVVDNLGAECPGFYEKYWDPRQADHGLGYGLYPNFLFSWIDLRD